MTTTVEQTLDASHVLLTVREIMRETGHAEEVVRAELKRLARAGQIDHIPGRGRYDGRYGLLRSIEKVAQAETTADGALANKGSTGGEQIDCQDNADGAIPAPEYDPRSVSFSPFERARAAHDETAGVLAVIADIRAAVDDKTGKIMLGDLASHIGKIYQLGEAHREACMNWERAMMQTIGEDVIGSVADAVEKLRADLANATALAAKLEHLLGVERQTSAALREQFVHANHGIIDSYAVVAPKRPIRRFTAHGSAVKSALAAASNGSGRGEVFGLVLLGAAKRGAVYREAGK